MGKIAWNRKTVSITLAAIIIPVSLLVAGLALNSTPREVENVSVDAESWGMHRPSNDTIIDECVKNSYNDTGVSISLEIHVYRYFEDDLYYSDYVRFRLNVTANVTEGFIDSVVVRYQLNPTSSDIGLDPDWFALRNLKMEKIEYYANYVTAVGINHPQNCSLKHWTIWTMGYNNSVEQAVKATAEILCFNGTGYQKIQIPIDLFVHAV